MESGTPLPGCRSAGRYWATKLRGGQNRACEPVPAESEDPVGCDSGAAHGDQVRPSDDRRASGSAHTDAEELAALMRAGQDILHSGQPAFELGIDLHGAPAAAVAVVAGMRSKLLMDAIGAC